ncbi:histone deacetylase-like amidohydrolase [bacterium BMS3Bbin07]|nr:histone deacetylase-like amidohydrolase [bacterium BMS3Bbin07]
MKKAGFIYDDVFLNHLPPEWHPESPQRLEAIHKRLKNSDIWDSLLHLKPQKASFEKIGVVHTKDYIERIKTFGTGYLDADTYMSEGTLEAALYASGAVMEAIEKCLQGVINSAFCAVRPPGHHAEADRAMGFCIFNNVAVGAGYARSLGYDRVFIVDFDVHHGNGTEHIFYEDDTVFYFSTHQYPHYPGTGSEQERGSGRGEGFTYNIPLPSGSGDKEYTQIYTEELKGLVSSFNPDIILISAGYDIHTKDPLSGIHVTDDGIRSIVKGILTAAEGVPAVFSLEGGYDLTALADSVLITTEEMLGM